MEIIAKKNDKVIAAETIRSIFVDGKVLAKGSKVEISGAEDVGRFGGLGNLDFLLPPEAQYEIVIGGKYRDFAAETSRPKEPARAFEAGDLITLSKERAQHFMLSGGKVKPVRGSGIPDLRFLSVFYYVPPLDETKAAPLHVQLRDREREERKQADKERGIFQAQLETGRVPGFVKGWRK